MRRTPRAWVACLTPFDQAGRLDEEALRRHLGRLRDAGVGAYIAGSNTGEYFALSRAERDRVFVIAAEELKGRVPVRASGFEPRNTADVIEYLGAAEAAGLDAAHVFQLDPGHGAKPNPTELEHYYDTILSATRFPVVLSNYPGLGYAIPQDLLVRLADRYSHFVAIRSGRGDPNYVVGLLERFRGRLEVYASSIATAPTALALGADGFLVGEGNIVPSLYPKLIAAWCAGDVERTETLYRHALALSALVVRFGTASGQGVKPMLTALGLPGGTVRPPRLPLAPDKIADMIEQFRALAIPGAEEVLAAGS